MEDAQRRARQKCLGAFRVITPRNQPRPGRPLVVPVYYLSRGVFIFHGAHGEQRGKSYIRPTSG